MQDKNVYELLEIIDSSSVGSFIYDIENGEAHYSYEWKKRLGIEHLSPREATLVPNTHVHPEDRDCIQRAILNAFEHKAAKVKMEYRMKTVDSGYIWVLGQGKIIYNQDGKPIKYYGTDSDITERKRAGEELQRYTAWLQAIINLIPAGIWISDQTGKMVMVNQEAVNMYRGSSPLVGSPEEYTAYKLFQPGTDEPVVFEPYVPKEAQIGVVMDYERFDGTRGTQVASTEALRDKDGNIINYVAIGMDITPLRQAERALQESESKHRFLLDTMNQAVVIIQKIETLQGEPNDYLYILTNPSFEKQTGLHNVVGRRVREVIPGLEQGVMDMYDEILYTGQCRQLEVYVSVLDKWFYQDNFPMQVEGQIAILQNDITQRKKAEEALLESDTKARELVAELEKADLNKTKFLNMLSHELRNPLATIMVSLDLMDKLIPEEQKNYKALEIAKRQGKQLTNLVDDLLDVTRISQNKITLKKETVEINELINKSVQDYQSQLIDKKVKLEVKLTTPLFLEADPSRITQVIGNLMHNAGKFTRDNDLVTVTVSHDTNSHKAVITVQDTGLGIDTNNLENLFEPFTQVDKTLARSNGGLGLGLAIVKGMVELHGGRVEAFSEGIGKGAKFTISLPLQKENVSIQEISEEPDSKSNKSLKILLIDDNKDLTEIICELIGFLGYETESAYNGADGIAKARELRPDVIICDIGLPNMNGYEVAKMIRKDAEFKDTFLIALSGYAQSEDIERSKEAGFDRHLAKPVSFETLQMVLAEVK
ncbi:MAG: response regulator [Thermoclostridium sp.]|nr:response regulator [Thermoclostridium sp.]